LRRKGADMQEIFAKIRARLADKEAEHFEYYNIYGHGEDYRLSLCYADAIEIVNDVEAEYRRKRNTGVRALKKKREGE
jgi:hypothetical protein